MSYYFWKFLKCIVVRICLIGLCRFCLFFVVELGVGLVSGVGVLVIVFGWLFVGGRY